MAKPNPIVRAWKYLSAWFGAKVDEAADPKIQIQQAIQESQRQHEALTQQAAAVLANQRTVELQLDRQLGQIERLQAEAKQALVLADKYRAEGDSGKASEFEQTAQVLASQLVAAESSVEDLKTLHDQSLQAATQARLAVQDSEARLRQRLTERTKLLTQLEQAKMQESVSRSLQQMNQLAAPSNVPTLDEVRDKIERRYALALSQADLAKTSVSGRMLEIQRVTADLTGSARLQEIRASLEAEKAAEAIAAAPSTPAIDAPSPNVDTTKQAQREAEPES